jgi:8-amino-7-oxononanoate synthase
MESCLVFPSGFMANLGVISALLGEGDAVIMDRLNHASLVDAAKLARCRLFIYNHLSMESLEKVLRRTKTYSKRLVVTDSLFSMDGDFAPLKAIADLCAQHKVWLMIDDAHATGVIGENGIGMAEHFGVLDKIQIVIGTLSKALGSQGGFVCGSKDLMAYLVNRARTFIYTTALAPASCASALASLEMIQKEPQRRKRLLGSVLSFQRKLESMVLKSRLKSLDSSFRWNDNQKSPIIPLHLGSAERTMAMAQQLKEAGIYAPAIRPPTVPKNQCRLRFSLTSEHTEQDLDRLFKALQITGKG